MTMPIEAVLIVTDPLWSSAKAPVLVIRIRESNKGDCTSHRERLCHWSQLSFLSVDLWDCKDPSMEGKRTHTGITNQPEDQGLTTGIRRRSGVRQGCVTKA